MARFAPFRKLRLAQLRRTRHMLKEARWEGIHSVICLIGQVTLDWAGVERILDELIAWNQHALTNLEAEHPRGLKNKLKYLRVMQYDTRFPEEMREWLRTTRIEIKRLGDRRHELIHGMMRRMPVPAGDWQSQRVIYDGAVARIKITKLTRQEIRQILIDVAALIGDLSPKVWVITGGDPKGFTSRDLEQARRELGLG